MAEPTQLNNYDIFILFEGDSNPYLLLTSKYPIRYLSWNSRSTLELEAARIRNKERLPEKLAKELEQKDAKEENTSLNQNSQDSNNSTVIDDSTQ